MSQVIISGSDAIDIQSALDAAQPGDTVKIPAGRIVMKEPLRIGSGTTLVGSGAHDSVLVLAPGSNTHVLVNRGDDCRDLTVRDLTIDGNRPEQDPPPPGRLAWAFGLWFRSVDGVRIERVAVRQVRQNGLQLNGCRRVSITDVVTHDTGWSGIATTNTDEIVLERVAVHRAGLDTVHSGIHLDGVVGGRVNALAEDCSGNAVMIDSVAGPVRSITVDATGRRARHGLALIASSHPLDEVMVSGSYADNEGAGVFVSNATAVSVIGVTATGNGQAGVVLQGARGCHRCLVASCQISGSPASVEELHGSSDNVITGTGLGSSAPQEDTRQTVRRLARAVLRLRPRPRQV